MPKKPSFQFYPGDWLKDPELRACTHEAKGLWIDMICFMYQQADGERGKMMVNGQPATDEQIARMTGCDVANAKRMLSELLANGVASRDPNDGAIICRRIRSEESKIAKCRESGAKGGRAKASKRPSERLANSTTSSSSSSSTSVKRQPLRAGAPRQRAKDELFEAVCAEFGHEVASLTKSQRGRINRAVKDLREQGATPDDIGVRAARYRTLWPRAECTETALAMHWPKFATDAQPNGHAPDWVLSPEQLRDD